MRIVVLPAIFCTFGFVSLIFYGSGTYLDDIPKTYESFTVAAFFNLMVYTITPDSVTRESYYVGLERLHHRRKAGRIHDKGSYRSVSNSTSDTRMNVLIHRISWYRVRSALVYQVPISSAVVCVLNGILYGTLCHTSKQYQTATTVLSVFNFLAQVLALTSIVDYYRRLRPSFRGTPIVRKFLVYKVMVWLIIHQQLILQIISIAKAVTTTSGTTSYMSYADFKYGIPEFMLCCETLIFSCLFQWSFSAFDYRKALSSTDFEISHTGHSPDASVGTYLLALFWPQDIFHEQWQAIKTLVGVRKGASKFDYTAGTGVGFPERFYGEKLSPIASDRSGLAPSTINGTEGTHSERPSQQHLTRFPSEVDSGYEQRAPLSV